MMLDISQLRTDYQKRSLSEREVLPDPIQQFTQWLDEAITAKANEPNAMTLATATRDGQPSARIVLLKRVNEDGFTFFTNYLSQKGRELESNPRASLVFFWPELERQVRVDGIVRRADDAEADTYFASRPLESRIGAAASAQSEAIESREALEKLFDEIRAKYPDGNIPRPAHWGGYVVRPTRFEFWQGRRSRLHDRIEYGWNEQAQRWVIRRLAP